MFKPHHLFRRLSLASLLLCTTLGFGRALAQEERASAQRTTQPAAASQTRERGIELYQQGRPQEALPVLRAAIKENQKDAEAWHFLGLTLLRTGDTKGARKAFERAVKLRPDLAESRTAWAYLLLLSNKNRDAEREARTALLSGQQNAEAHYVLAVVHSRAGQFAEALERVETALKVKPDFAIALLLKSQVLTSLYMEETTASNTEPVAVRYAHLKAAAESLDKYLKLAPDAKDAAFWREQLETLQVYANAREERNKPDSERTVFAPREVTTKARILRRAEPQYTEDARQNRVEGTVVLKAIFDADGTVKRILVVRALGHGLTEQAVAAARKIKFIPATKDGRPVSQYIQIEYNFNLY